MRRLLAISTAVCALAALCLPALAGEGRIPIYTWPTVISSPGMYIVTQNLNATGSGASVIIVQAPDVSIDLNGFVLETDGAPVIQAIGVTNLTIRNGTLKRGTRGIDMSLGPGPTQHKVVIEHVNVIGAQGEGIFLVQVSDFAIRWCNLLKTGREGIWIDGVGPAPQVVAQGTIEHNRLESTAGITVRWGSSVAIVNNRLEDTTVVAFPPSVGAIVYDYSYGGLVASNTVENIVGGSGIFLGDAKGNKIYNNVVRESRRHGIHLAGMSDDNLVLENVVSGCGSDGVLVEGSRNQVDRNVMNLNCQGGAPCWGLHLSAAWGGLDNTFGRNTARGNLGAAAACPAAPPYPPTTDFCNEQPGAGSFNDNYMPNFF